MRKASSACEDGEEEETEVILQTTEMVSDDLEDS